MKKNPKTVGVEALQAEVARLKRKVARLKYKAKKATENEAFARSLAFHQTQILVGVEKRAESEAWKNQARLKELEKYYNETQGHIHGGWFRAFLRKNGKRLCKDCEKMIDVTSERCAEHERAGE